MITRNAWARPLTMIVTKCNSIYTRYDSPVTTTTTTTGPVFPIVMQGQKIGTSNRYEIASVFMDWTF